MCMFELIFQKKITTINTTCNHINLTIEYIYRYTISQGSRDVSSIAPEVFCHTLSALYSTLDTTEYPSLSSENSLLFIQKIRDEVLLHNHYPHHHHHDDDEEEEEEEMEESESKSESESVPTDKSVDRYRDGDADADSSTLNSMGILSASIQGNIIHIYCHPHDIPYIMNIVYVCMYVLPFGLLKK